MKNITTYFAGRKNYFTRLAALCMIVSAIARIVSCGRADRVGVMVVVVRTLLPIAANLIFALVLLLRGEKQFYVTRVPVVLLAIVFIDRVAHLRTPGAMTAICIVFCILQAVLYCITYRGIFKSKIWVLLSWIVPFGVFFADAYFRQLFVEIFASNP